MKQRFRPLTAILAALLLAAAACGETAATDTGASADGGAADTAIDGSTDDDTMDEDSMDEDSMDDDTMDDGTLDDTEDGHGHGEPLEVPDGMAVPSVSVSAEPDTVNGHNVFIEVDDFDIAPESASIDPVDGEGHLHLYVDGERVMRFYNTAIHLTGLSEGEHEVMVEVSANNHSAYAVDGEPIRAMTTVTVGETGDGHDGGHGDDAEPVEPSTDMSLELSVTEDPKSGWNVAVTTAGIDLAPESVGGEHVDGEGHLHLYVDGERITRLYGTDWHLSDLEAGTREITVEAATNDHRSYGVDGEAVGATVELTIAESDDDSMEDGDSDDSVDETGDGNDEPGGEPGNEHGDEPGDEQGHGEHHGTGETLDIGAAEADTVVEVTITGDDVEVPDRRINVDEGTAVGVIVTSDREEQIHVHGYDLLADIGPASPTGFAFLADSAGVFEVELEQSGRFLFEIVVR